MPNYQQIIAGDPPYGGDSGQQFANKINGNFDETNNALTSVNQSINNVNTTLGNRLTTVENNKMNKQNPTGSGSFSVGRKENTTIGTNSFVAGGTDNIAASPNQHVQGRYNVSDANSTYADIIGNGTADDNRKNIEATDWNGNKRLKGDVYVGCNDDSSGGTKLATTDAPLSGFTDDTDHKTVSQTQINTWNGKQDSLVFDATPSASNPVITKNNTAITFGTNPDTTPTENSTKGVESGGVYTDIRTQINANKVNRNLLDNPYFKIDQRQGYIIPSGTTYYSDTALTTSVGTVSEYTKATYVNSTYGSIVVGSTTYYVAFSDMVRGYCERGQIGVDRWALWCTDLKMNVKPVSNGLQLSVVADGNIYQNIEQLDDGDYTLSAIDTDGNIAILKAKVTGTTVTVVEYTPSTTLQLNMGHNGTIFWVNCVVRNANSTVTPEAMKLELGSISTLEAEIASGAYDEDLDLWKCQYYLQPFELEAYLSARVWGSGSAADAVALLPLKRTMRLIRPTLQWVSGIVNVLWEGNGQWNLTPTTTIETKADNIAQIYILLSPTTLDMKPATAWFNNTKFLLSAEL